MIPIRPLTHPAESGAAAAALAAAAPHAAGPTAARSAAGPNAAKSAKKPVDPALKHVAEEFEGVLLRQLLQNAEVGGKKGSQGYGSMAVDALATGLLQGGGLGLARAIEQTVAEAQTPRRR
jgi:Rod binding domain-containing protein